MRVVPVDDLRDPRVADYRNVKDADLRSGRGLFLAEGRLNVKRLVRGDAFRTRSVFLTRAAFESLKSDLEVLPEAVPVYLAPQAVLNDVVGYAMHRGCLAAAERSSGPGFRDALARDTAEPRVWVALEDVTNPDNVGGILRNALAFGVEQVLLSPRSVDPLYRKSLRVSMGAALRVPFCRAPAWPEELDALRAAGFRLLALDAGRGAASLAPGDAVPTCGPRRLLLLVGNEGEGLSPAVLARADARVAIPMADGIDSLNAATATGIALHAIAAALEIV